MKLVIGNEYTVTDWFGMHCFSARYAGQVKEKHSGNCLYLLERDPVPDLYTFAGCEIRTTVDRDGEVTPYLFATHYGNSLSELSPCGSRRNYPEWELSRHPMNTGEKHCG